MGPLVLGASLSVKPKFFHDLWTVVDPWCSSVTTVLKQMQADKKKGRPISRSNCDSMGYFSANPLLFSIIVVGLLDVGDFGSSVS